MLRVAPLPAIGDYTWEDFPLGASRFNVSSRRTDREARIRIVNKNRQSLEVETLIPADGLGNSYTVAVNGNPISASAPVQYLGHAAVRVSAPVPGEGTLEFVARRGAR